MNLREVDLNLLIVLDALLIEAHVSRAAERVGLSQPATSNALERCRTLFNDRLLERSAGGMRLTPKALALREPLKQALSAIGAVINVPNVQFESVTQNVRVLMPDYPAICIIYQLQKRLAESAPLVSLVIEPWRGVASALDDIERGHVDLAVSTFPLLELPFQRKELLREHYVIVMNRHHPAAADFNLSNWLAYPHILISDRGEVRDTIDDCLALQGLSRRVGMVVPSISIASSLLLDSELIATLPSRYLSIHALHDFVHFELPITYPDISVQIVKHARRDQDLVVQHVAQLIEEILI